MPRIHGRKEIEVARGREDQARYEQLLSDLETLARNSPIQLKSTCKVQALAAARYRASLISIIEVAAAQPLLTAAELADSLGRLGTWPPAWP